MCGNGVYADNSVFSFHPVKHIACGREVLLQLIQMKYMKN